MYQELSAEQARKRCAPSVFDCSSTKELQPIEGIIGQDRALSALKFGLNVPQPGFNIFVSGLSGTGRTTAIKSFLDALARQKETPPDWCYVHNFSEAYCPKSLRLPAGMGQSLQKDVRHTIENARRGITQAFTGITFSQGMEA